MALNSPFKILEPFSEKGLALSVDDKGQKSDDPGNLDSIRWYLKKLSEEASELQFPNGEQFGQAAAVAEAAVAELLAFFHSKRERIY